MAKIEELSRNNVHMRDKDHVMNTIMKMVKDGPNKLQRDMQEKETNTVACTEKNIQLSVNVKQSVQILMPLLPTSNVLAPTVVADFDRTLSKYTHRGNVCATCHNVLEEGGLPEEYKQKAYKIRDKYFPIETDPNMTIEEKIPHMIEWWTQAHELLVKYPLSKEMLHNMVANSTARLRDGCIDFFDKLHKCDVPLLIFSAGVGDIIRELISQHSTFYDNMHVVSNDLDFDDNGKMIGFKGEIIHVFNKNENAVHDSDYFSNLSHCTNVLLMGDSLGDLQMANGAENVEAKLTIGFLNTRVAESLELYKSKYDIVICEDETLDVANAIVNRITGTV